MIFDDLFFIIFLILTNQNLDFIVANWTYYAVINSVKNVQVSNKQELNFSRDECLNNWMPEWWTEKKESDFNF